MSIEMEEGGEAWYQPPPLPPTLDKCFNSSADPAPPTQRGTILNPKGAMQIFIGVLIYFRRRYVVVKNPIIGSTNMYCTNTDCWWINISTD